MEGELAEEYAGEGDGERDEWGNARWELVGRAIGIGLFEEKDRIRTVGAGEVWMRGWDPWVAHGGQG